MARGRFTRPLRLLPILLLGITVAGCQTAARQPLATLRPATLAPTASATASRPSASPDPSDAVVGKFVDLVTSDDFSYRAALTGTASGAADTLDVTGSIDVSEADYALAVDWKFPRSDSYKVDVRRLGDRVWSRVTGTDWQEIEGFLDEDSNSPFAFVESEADVEYVEPVEVDDEKLHKIAIAESRIVDPSYIPAVNLSAESTRRTTFEVLVDDAGRPVSGAWRLNGAGRVSGQLQEIAIRLDLDFADIGEAIRIREP